jgi:hypothetical protein
LPGATGGASQPTLTTGQPSSGTRETIDEQQRPRRKNRGRDRPYQNRCAQDRGCGFSAIAEAASKYEEVSINGFGKFKVKATPAREGRNPATGEPIQIAAARKLAFTPAKAVKDKLNA